MFLDANKILQFIYFQTDSGLREILSLCDPEENIQFFSNAHETSGLRFSQDEDTCMSVLIHELGVLIPSSAEGGDACIS